MYDGSLDRTQFVYSGLPLSALANRETCYPGIHRNNYPILAVKCLKLTWRLPSSTLSLNPSLTSDNISFPGKKRGTDSNTQLSSLQPKFTHNDATFLKCRHLHKLLVTGEDDEVLRRKEEFTPSLLSHSCQYKKGNDSVNQVNIKSLLSFCRAP